MQSKRAKNRRGATLVESAVVATLLVTGMFTLLDLGLLVLRQNALTAAARNLARRVTIRGADHPFDVSRWGSEPQATTVEALDAQHTDLQPRLPAADGSAVQVRLRWPLGENGSGDPAQIEMNYVHHSILGPVVPWHASVLRATTTVGIVN